MAKALPLKAFRLVPLYDVVSMALPLSRPTIAPGPVTEKVNALAAVGTKIPFASWTSAVMKARSFPFALMVLRFAESA